MNSNLEKHEQSRRTLFPPTDMLFIEVCINRFLNENKKRNSFNRKPTKMVGFLVRAAVLPPQ